MSAQRFSDAAGLDDGPMWPTSFALTAVTTTEKVEIKKLLNKAVSGSLIPDEAPGATSGGTS